MHGCVGNCGVYYQVFCAFRLDNCEGLERCCCMQVRRAGCNGAELLISPLLNKERGYGSRVKHVLVTRTCQFRQNHEISPPLPLHLLDHNKKMGSVRVSPGVIYIGVYRKKKRKSPLGRMQEEREKGSQVVLKPPGLSEDVATPFYRKGS